ncbi:NAD-dependent epimerase/dehydratase family protein [Streptomyces sp. NPDC048332]|uniref:NAD-dependent epimerase/dehydratase family protein n=1 Tax=Streptomyces sp. NPDC048332 TaxID=3154619 RepID=UPI0034395741
MSVYGNTKACGETQTSLTLGSVATSYTVVRHFSVHGEPQVIKENSHSWVVAWFADRASLGLPLHLNGGGNQIRALAHAGDIAETTVRSLVAPRAHNETINMGSGTPTSIRAVAEPVAEQYPGTRFMETPLPPGDPTGGYPATSRMESVRGWRPAITIEQGVVHYANWLASIETRFPHGCGPRASRHRPDLR